jgi:hypothetical protein
MNAQHLKTLTEVLMALEPQHTRLRDVHNELHGAYDDQSGAWRFTDEGSDATEEIVTIEEIVGALENAINELRQFVFLLSDNPDFATIIAGHDRQAVPLPDVLPSREEICALPRRPGAPPYPFLKRTDGEDG